MRVMRGVRDGGGWEDGAVLAFESAGRAGGVRYVSAWRASGREESGRPRAGMWYVRTVLSASTLTH